MQGPLSGLALEVGGANKMATAAHKYQPPLAEGANVRQNSLMTDHIDMLATACSKTLQNLRLQIVTI